jgi:hypothetical protein
MTARGLVALLATLRVQIAVFERRIKELVAAHPDGALFASLPGAGAALTPRLIIVFGTRRDRFDSAYEVQCYSGIAPVTEASGKSHQVRFRWSCPKFFSGKPFTNSQANRYANAIGLGVTINCNAIATNRIRLPSAHWPTNGFASFFDVGKTVNPMTSRYTSARFAAAQSSWALRLRQPPTAGGRGSAVSRSFPKIFLDGTTQKTPLLQRSLAGRSPGLICRAELVTGPLWMLCLPRRCTDGEIRVIAWSIRLAA